MSTTRNIIKALDSFSNIFMDKFDFYLDSFDSMLKLQSDIGFSNSELKEFNSHDSDLIKSYLFFVEASNTTVMGALRLFNSNFYSDAYSLVRIMYETACVLHYGNISEENKIEIHKIFFSTSHTRDDQNRNEWKLVQQSQKQFESEKPGLFEIRKDLNNYGSHLSGKKIILGNLTMSNGATVSSLFFDNTSNARYLMGLELIHNIYNMILEEYTIHLISFSGATVDHLAQIRLNSSNIENQIRPRLLNMRKE